MLPSNEANSLLQGSVAYALAALACAVAGFRGSGSTRWRRGWRALATAYALLFVDMQLSLRFELKNAMSDIARNLGLYDGRRTPQLIALGALGCVALLVFVVIVRSRLESSSKLALLGLATSLGCVALELVSLHRVDRIVYHYAGPSTVIAWLWTTGGVLAAAGALMHLRSVPSAGGPRR